MSGANGGPTSAEPGTEKWAFETEDAVVASPTVVDGTVYVGDFDENLYAVDAASGEQEWAFETGDWLYSSPTVVDGTVYVGGAAGFGSDDGTLYAVAAASGTEEWAFETGDQVASSPTVTDGAVYVGSHDNHLYAVDAASGEEEWAFETGGQVFSSPTVADGTVYVGSMDKHLYAVDAASGEETWAFETGHQVRSSPTVIDGTVYVGSDDNHLYAVEAASGTEEWAFETGRRVRSSPTVADGTVYVGSDDFKVYAVATERTSPEDTPEESDSPIQRVLRQSSIQGAKPRVLRTLREMDPYKFEQLIAHIWSARGWDTEVTQGATDRGVDVIATKQDAFEQRRHLIQAKRHGENTTIGSEDIQRYAGLYARDEDVDGVFVVTSSGFTSEAKTVADNRDVTLINAAELYEMLRET